MASPSSSLPFPDKNMDVLVPLDPESGEISRDRWLDHKSHRIWCLRKWRSIPRMFQLFLILSTFMAFLLFVLVLFAGTDIRSPESGASFSILGLNNEVPIPDPVVRPSDQRSVTQEDPNNDLVFQFLPQNRYREISYDQDLLTQTLTPDQEKVVDAISHSWQGYKDHAWGYDSLMPISKGGSQWFRVGLTIVDSLDTLMFAGKRMEKEVTKSLKWIHDTLTFDVYQDVNCFEMTIRVLGGLLSGFHLNKSPVLLWRSLDVGDRLIHCFDSASKTIPFSDVNLRTKAGKTPQWSHESSLSEVSTMQLEFRDLSRMVKQPKFEETSFATSLHLHDQVSKRGDPLLPMYVNPHTGAIGSGTITLGARGDSYYEYLLKQHIQTGVQWLKDDYLDAVDAIRSRLVKTTEGPLKLVYVSEILRSGDTNPKMDHLVCFLPGTLALGHYHFTNGLQDSAQGTRWEHHLSLAKQLARTCWITYNMTATKLAPEITHFGLHPGEEEVYIKPADSHNLLRPEYVESLYYLYHVTKEASYRDQGRIILDAFDRFCKVPTGGYSSINSVVNADNVQPRDKMESFWTAETLKYLFLLFSDDQDLIRKIFDHYVFNTEGHLVPILVEKEVAPHPFLPRNVDPSSSTVSSNYDKGHQE